MLFFKYTYSHNGMQIREQAVDPFMRSSSRSIKQEGVICKDFCDEFSNIEFFITNKTEEHITFLCLFDGQIKGLHDLDKRADELIIRLNLDMLIVSRQELTALNFIQELETAEINNFISSAREIKDTHDLNFYSGLWFKEKKLKKSSKSDLLKRCEELVVNNELKNEVERIFKTNPQNSFGVPAHYIVSMSNSEERNNVVEILLESLHSNNRTIRNHYSVVDFTLKEKISHMSYIDIATFFNLNMGGVVVLYANFDMSDDDRFSDEHMITEMFAYGILKNSANVTTIICCKHKSQEQVFKDNLRDLLLVEINDVTISNSIAKNYLKNYANSLDIENISGLLEMVEPDMPYKTNDLITIFNKWHKKYVKTIQFPQYCNLIENKPVVEHKQREVALTSLNEMVGLTSIKQTIDNFINYSKLQKACTENGSVAKNTCRHMCFIGNPGTAKTTVARYVAQVMKEQGLLSRGKLIEVGRADIVSKYIGGTAPKVKELFRAASGNVLFIDEAYSLYDGKEGLYGDEAINAIVQEMENKRDDVVVIFAGYKKEMQNFIDRNSGLKSRIASIIEFPDYSEEELLDITKLQAAKMDVDISNCEDKIRNILTFVKSKETNFGNGRFVRTMLEKARMQQATRLVKEDKLFGENLRILKPDDFEIPKIEEKIKMGFC